LGILVAVAGVMTSSAAVADSRVALVGHVARQIQSAVMLESAPSDERVQLGLAVKLDPELLSETLDQLYGSHAPAYRHFLSSSEFMQKFGLADKRAMLKNFAQANGLLIDPAEDKPESMVVKVSGSAAAVNTAFNVRMNHYRDAQGHVFRAQETEPTIPASLAPHLSAVLGLSNVSGVMQPHFQKIPISHLTGTHGHDNGNGLAPVDIKTVYGLNSILLTGTGQTIALAEFDGYDPSDITTYENVYNIAPLIQVTPILVDAASNVAGENTIEVVLDVEMVAALAPGVSQILVYESPNNLLQGLDLYDRIATENIAQVASTSWGLDEQDATEAIIQPESQIFQRMAIQGQTMYAASGDCGAYDQGPSGSCITNNGFRVDDPASQPYVTGVGGTILSGSVLAPTETVWNTLSQPAGGATGGGISGAWTIPLYQQGVAGTASQSARNVPDVALNAGSGYSVYVNGAWSPVPIGGTSAAAPLWAALTALINQERAATGKGPLGFANPALYQIGTSTNSTSAFHDIVSGNNALYSAGSGYDNATGWGSFRGVGMISNASDAPSNNFSTALNNVYAYPNPWDKRKTTKRQVTFANLPDGTTVKIFTVSGFWVKTLPTASAGGTAWDLTNDDGKSVASGLYFYLASSGSSMAKGTIAIIR